MLADIRLFKERSFSSYVGSRDVKDIEKQITEAISKPNFDMEATAKSVSDKNKMELLTFEDIKNPKKEIKMSKDNRGRDESIVEYNFKFAGDYSLFRVTPSFYNYQGAGIPVQIPIDEQLRVTVATEYATVNLPDDIIKNVLAKKNEFIEILEKSVEALNKEITLYNGALHNTVLDNIKRRKAELDNQKEILGKL